MYSFFFFTRQNESARKIGRASEVLRARPRPIGIPIQFVQAYIC